MLFRQAGVFHTNYAADRALFPIAADRWMIGILLIIGLAAPFVVNSLYLSSYLLPLLVWTAGALGLNLILGWAGQFHLGYAAVMGIGAYATVHANKAGIPWEIAILIGGATASIIGIGFAFAALRVKGLYLALSTLALQFVMDWTISHVPAISGGTQATLQAPDIRLLGQPITSDAGLYYVAFVWCILVTSFMLNLRRTALGRALVAVREKDFAAAVIGVNSFYFKLVAFATSSFIGGVTGAILIGTFYHAVTPEQFSVDVSIQALAMVIVGGLGSIIGSYFGAAFILLMPGAMNSLISWAAIRFGFSLSIETLAHLPQALYGALIIGFLLVEPLGLGKIYKNVRDYLLVWPFGYVKK
ncbi:MAG: branched-chain amino acid ABC transporter permease [Bradyrhizobium sp.]|jgi:branched-chain amino acid transport system permease protein|uniref:branched-chain amino acid ABC transporter permease n=1 Tax=Bradyrhizobium TaxID=374 RepID=UPI00040C03F2|nr:MULTISPECIES: branched-chain amino acid ABC transporter permease [Bradyrhizobium]MBJ7403193.1 branched-chain amino acid ABC transporter permease [Bradyrhizobium sp.]